jgi:hypothetical protein
MITTKTMDIMFKVRQQLKQKYPDFFKENSMVGGVWPHIAHLKFLFLAISKFLLVVVSMMELFFALKRIKGSP